MTLQGLVVLLLEMCSCSTKGWASLEIEAEEKREAEEEVAGVAGVEGAEGWQVSVMV